MSRRALLFVVCASMLACGPRQPPPADPPRVWNVGPRALYDAYLIGDDVRWDGQTVRVALAAGSYVLGARAVHWHGDRATDGPDLVFECDRPPVDATKAVFLTGRVKGRVGDSARRSSGARWHVRLTGCSVTAP